MTRRQKDVGLLDDAILVSVISIRQTSRIYSPRRSAICATLVMHYPNIELPHSAY